EGEKRLPVEDGEAIYTVKMGVARRQRHIALQRDGGDPEVVFRNDLTLRLQRHGCASIALRGGAVRVQQRGHFQKGVYDLAVVSGARGFHRTFIELAEGDEREEERFAGSGEGENVDAPTQVRDHRAPVEKDAG